MVVSPVIDAEEPYRINAGSWFFDRELHHSSGEDGGDPPAVFNVLDLVLIETMERLKKLRCVRMLCMYVFDIIGLLCLEMFVKTAIYKSLWPVWPD